MTDEELRERLAWGRQRLEEMGVFRSPEGLRWAAAHGNVLFVWRNGPIEDAHASPPSKRRKNLHDGAMFARNTWLTRQAFDALGSSEPFRLLELEDVILDREAVWPGCDGTLTDFGWGFLGEIKKHVKRRIDTLMHFEEQLPHDDFLIFMAAPQLGTHDDHFGMPRWPACVKAAIRRLRGEDEEFFRKRGDLMKRIGPAPDSVTTDLERTEKALLNAPWELGAEALGWFAWNPILRVPRPSPPTC
ncbi:hypothetical protein [Streptomyces sp. NBC_00076]|uniref:hypothetical protein n=1 Tax=Streptomyces sp. NBC_00076 TaxID=2975642 RepID=UPI00324C3FA7